MSAQQLIKSHFIRQLALALTAIMGFCSLGLVFSAGKLAIIPTLLSSLLVVLVWKQRQGRLLYFATLGVFLVTASFFPGGFLYVAPLTILGALMIMIPTNLPS
jgi:hypothetical protein